MAQPIVITGGTPGPAGDEATAFQAGAASVVAVVAAAEAGQATEVAEAAADTADQAAASAERAHVTAQEVADRVDRLEERVLDLVGDLVDALTDQAAAGGPVSDDGAPELVTLDAVHVEAPADAITAPPAEKKPRKDRKFGSDRWFGGR